MFNMHGMQVLLYNGNVDLICPLVATEGTLATLQWNSLPLYRSASKQSWKVNSTDSDVAGYVRQVENLIQVGIDILMC